MKRSGVVECLRSMKVDSVAVLALGFCCLPLAMISSRRQHVLLDTNSLDATNRDWFT